MDFSRYAAPSEQWLQFAKQNPDAVADGYQGNSRDQAADLRASANKKREAVAAQTMQSFGLNEKVTIETLHVPSRGEHTIPIRRYAPQGAEKAATSKVLLFFHGGGYLFGSETTDDVLCATTALERNATVLSVIYRHTPEFKHPAQTDDSWDAFVHLRDRARDLRVDISNGIGVMGISAGAGLAASVVYRNLLDVRQTRRPSKINGLVLSIPWLIHIDNYPFDEFACREKSAKIQNQEVPVVPAPRMRLFSDILGAQYPTDPLLNIALIPDSDLTDWPRTGFLIAGMDPLRDDGLLFATRLKAAGVDTKVHIFPGVPHGFRRWPGLPICKTFDKCGQDGVEWALDGSDNVKGTISEWQEYS